jgi:uncharacterized protein YggU (UPF0235/DUF167 family)
MQDGTDVLVAVRVQPCASRNQLVIAGTQPIGLGAQPAGPGAQRFTLSAQRDAPGALGEELGPDSITIRVTAPAVEGAANAACRAFLAHLLGIAPSRIIIARGGKARNKLLRIRDADVVKLLARLTSQK